MRQNSTNSSWMLLAVLFCGLSTSFVACSDDDEKLSEEELRELEARRAQDPFEKCGDQAMALLQVVSQLTAADTLPDNWREATFEPTRGIVADASKPYVRWQTVASADEARRIFQSLCGQTVPEGTTTLTWQADGVGSMTFAATAQPDCYATIDISIRQMPHLTQLRLVPTSALGDNALKMKPYYRIGDIVQDKNGRYWVCVRSAGHDVDSKADKKTTHWITLQLLSTNQQTYAATAKRFAHIVPTKLGGAQTEHLTYFAQLMWVLQRPQDYKAGTKKGYVFESGLGCLGTNRVVNPYAYDWGDIQFTADVWNRLGLWDKLLPKGIKKEDLISGDSLCIFYNGFSSPMTSSNMTLYYAKQSGKTLSVQELRTVKWNMNTGVGFNIMDYALGGAAGAGSTAPGIPQRAIVVCQGTGKTLADTWLEPDYDKPIEGVKPVYVANTGLINTYYHLGDLVKDRDGRHWFCILPYDDLNDPESHWITMQTLSEDSPVTGFPSNYQVVEPKAGVHGLHVMPASQDVFEDIYASYFAQLLYLYNNHAYEKNLDEDSFYATGLYGFGKDLYDAEWAKNMCDFFMYGHNWKTVRPGTVDYDFPTNSTYHFILSGYADEGKAGLHMVRISGLKRNLYQPYDVSWDMTGGDNVKFDVRDYQSSGKPNPANTTIADAPASGIMLSHATGTQLAGGLLIDRHDITQPIKGLEEVRTMYHPYVIKK